MKIGYIAYHLWGHTFEINEAQELTRQHPDVRLYSVLQPNGDFQRRRVRDLQTEIVTWSYGSILRGWLYLKKNHPIGVIKGALMLAARSAPNPVYWVKNAALFLGAMPILADASRHKVTHLHANFGSSPATVAWLGKKILGTGMSVTYHAHDIYSQNLSRRDPLKRSKLRESDLVVALHEDGREYLQQLVPDVDGNKFKVIRICVMFDPEDKRVESDVPPLLLAAGHLVRKKGFDTLINAVGELKRRTIPVRLRILGDGPERPLLEKLTREQGIRDRVEFLGYYQHQDLAKHLSEACVFVQPSRVTETGQRDGIPSVIVEAWLSRTPVIASLVGGMPEVVMDEETGLVFPSDDSGALADTIVRLVGSPDLQRRLSDAGHDVATSLFSSRTNVLSLLEGIRGHVGV